MNKDRTWKFQPLISFQSERSCQSVFVTYNDLSDSSPSGKNGGIVRDEIMVLNLCISGDQNCEHSLGMAIFIKPQWENHEKVESKWMFLLLCGFGVGWKDRWTAGVRRQRNVSEASLQPTGTL